MTNNVRINEMEAAGRKAVQNFISGIKVKLHKTGTIEDAVNDGDQTRTTILGKFNELINTYDALGLHKVTRAYRECIEKATVNDKTSLLMLGKALDAATDQAIADLESDVRYCIDHDVPPMNAIKALGAVRCLKNGSNGHSVPGALVRALLYVVQATVSKISKWLGSHTESTIWNALGKALKCFAGLLKVGVTIVRKVVKGAACYIVAGATKIGQLFMRAFYICIGVLSTWISNKDKDIGTRTEAAAEELFEEFFADDEVLEQMADYDEAEAEESEKEPIEEEQKSKKKTHKYSKKHLFGRFVKR